MKHNGVDLGPAKLVIKSGDEEADRKQPLYSVWGVRGRAHFWGYEKRQITQYQYNGRWEE